MKPLLKKIQIKDNNTIYLKIHKEKLEKTEKTFVHNGIIKFLWEYGLKSEDDFINIDTIFEESSENYTYDEGPNYKIHVINTSKNVHVIIETQVYKKRIEHAIKLSFEY